MIRALFAIDQNGGMGIDGSMPWPRNKEDMVWFKSKTQNQVVVMGRKTWDSKDMPSPLPNRINVIVSHRKIDDPSVIHVSTNICDNIKKIQQEYSDKDVYIIGGPTILKQCVHIIEEAFITEINGTYKADSVLNINEFTKNFQLINTTTFETCIVRHYGKI